MGVVNTNGVRLCYDVYGMCDPPPMVLLHGLGGTRSTWRAVAAAFAHSRRVYAVDLRGHGDSDRPGRYSVELMRDDVLALVAELGLRGVVLVGHSLGGVIAWLVAREQPAWLSHIVLEDAPPPRAGMRPVPLRDRPSEPQPFDWAAIEAIVRQINNPDPEWWRNPAAVTTPTLVIAGGPDSHVPQDLLVELAAVLPHGRLATIPVGHHIHRARPAAFIECITEFLTTSNSAL